MTEETPRSSPENPWPVRVVSQKIGSWIARLGWIWVDGQVAQITPAPRLKCGVHHPSRPSADLSLSVTTNRDVLDLGAPDAGGRRPDPRAREAGVLSGPRQPVAASRRGPPGRPGRAAGPARTPEEAAGGRGAVRPAPQAPAAVPAGPDRPDHRPRLRRRAGRADEHRPALARGRLSGDQRGRAGHIGGAADDRRHLGARSGPDDRRDRAGAGRRLDRGPVAVLRRGAVPCGVRLHHARSSARSATRPTPRWSTTSPTSARPRRPMWRSGSCQIWPRRSGSSGRPGLACGGPSTSSSTASSTGWTHCAAGRSWLDRR